MRSVVDDIREAHSSNLAALRATRLLRLPWFWPPDGPLLDAAKRRFPSPRSLSPGEALLVSVDLTRTKATLSRLSRTTSAAGDGHGAFGREAIASIEVVEQIVYRTLPAFGWSHLLPDGRWLPERLLGDPCSLFVDRSFGAAMLLAATSLLLDQPVPSDLTATAEVTADGRLKAVGGLETKIRCLEENAPGIARLAVASEQAQEARSLARSITICAATDALELVTLAFPGAETPSFKDTRQAEDVADRLFALVLLDEPSLPAWGFVVKTAEAAMRILDPGGISRWKADFAMNVALRHDGRASMLEWPEPWTMEALPKPLRSRCLAHVVQDLADNGRMDLPGRVAELRSNPHYMPPRPERGDPDLRLLGAVGRALARLRFWQQASGTLEDAAKAWFDILQGYEASRPLCELARVDGIRVAFGETSSDRLLVADELSGRILKEPRLDKAGRAYVRLALGRAWVMAGDAERGVFFLGESESDWDVLKGELPSARLRWLARASDLRGDRRTADSSRRRLASASEEGGQGLLAELDVALRDDRDPQVAVDRILAHPALLRELRFTLQQCGNEPVRQLGRRIANECPY